eukprot:CAMPEP_0114333714 /NCGR_PEP_ID=MMETSP0101-20121206/3923_1 /TAXON_ID=38822 ORGANISM="Pteridomonas danica, Strain PT" /NCGR_SAMPLE_ID=MMETSP0101 /ASSEMBLY_ACC=CAM_ASM_000211 /LENGTH=426 /DNA_ID=CAMNT_0001464793 /DNA_START=60 /DNA_END=1339 /DNA_ORIENTATION=-
MDDQTSLSHADKNAIEIENSDNENPENENPENESGNSSASETETNAQLLSQIAELKVALENEKATSETLRSRLRSVLWDYIPKQRKVIDIPPDTGLVTLGRNIEIVDYELKNLIGAGSFGSVYASRNVKNGERVAIKIIDLDKQLRLSDVIALEQEIRAMKVLCHPNLVRLSEVIRGRRHICLVMNLVMGGNCYQYTQNNFPLAFVDIRRIFLGLLSGVNAMHQRGFVHRDIKPENILLDESNEAVIADLGLCTKTTPGTMIRDIVGTNGFMAPELGNGRPFEPMPADIFSVGCTLLELVYGNGTIKPLMDISRGNASQKMNDLQKSVFQKSNIRASVTSTADTEVCLDFVACSLRLDPKLRIPAPRALEHPFIAIPLQPVRSRLGTAGGDSENGSQEEVRHARSDSEGSDSKSENQRKWQTLEQV